MFRPAQVYLETFLRLLYETYKTGRSLKELAQSFSLSEKSIQRILRDQRVALKDRVDKWVCFKGKPGVGPGVEYLLKNSYNL